jgi:DNA replication and repair protein RecF
LARIDGVPGRLGAGLQRISAPRLADAGFDGLFRGAAGDRRRFLDRLVLAVDPTMRRARTRWSGRCARATASSRRAASGQWLDAVEREIAELGVAVAAARAETVARLSAIIAETSDDASPFPYASLALAGEIDTLVAQRLGARCRGRIPRLLRQARPRDRAAGRTLIGPQASDLEVRHGPRRTFPPSWARPASRRRC